MVPKNQV